ncbi:hypothetical protein ZWY2020_031277 [Hordeum vulgare]|nr:hypothetical protein ZWY2020_031277 [Hordeum vulgare]
MPTLCHVSYIRFAIASACPPPTKSRNSERRSDRYDTCRSIVKHKRNQGRKKQQQQHSDFQREMKQRRRCSSLLRHALLLLLLLLLPLVFLAAVLLNVGGLLLVGGSNAVLHKSMGERNGGRAVPPAPNASADPHT